MVYGLLRRSLNFQHPVYSRCTGGTSTQVFDVGGGVIHGCKEHLKILYMVELAVITQQKW